ncbi:hypothetical protein KR018_010115 [Drosophila ironensis]|nr:hypothetical protein KR018_010115 [Drosophila ironensis]
MENNMASGLGAPERLIRFDVVLTALEKLGRPVPLEDLVEYIESQIKYMPHNNCHVQRSIIRLVHYGMFVDCISIQNGFVSLGKALQTSEDDHQDLAVTSSGSDRVIFHINSSSRSLQSTAAADDSIDCSSEDPSAWSTTAVYGSNPRLGPIRSEEWNQCLDMPLSSSVALNLNYLAQSEQRPLSPALSCTSLPSWASPESNQDTSGSN